MDSTTTFLFDALTFDQRFVLFQALPHSELKSFMPDRKSHIDMARRAANDQTIYQNFELTITHHEHI